jgi:hypothetical protein
MTDFARDLGPGSQADWFGRPDVMAGEHVEAQVCCEHDVAELRNG